MSSCQHDALDWFAAIGPTVATLAAVGATIWATVIGRQVSRDAAALQKRISAPRLNLLERIRAVPESGIHWILDLSNDGQTVGSVQEFRVLVDRKPFDGRPFEDPPMYWKSVLEALGLMRFGSLQANRIVPPVSISPGAPMLLFETVIIDPPQHVRQCMRRLHVEIEYLSPWGERFTLAHDLCAEHERQLGGESPLPSLMEVKG